jgi:iron complex outermembrane receptor protein
MTADAALAQLLAGTGLASSKSPEGMFLVAQADVKGASSPSGPPEAPVGAPNDQSQSRLAQTRDSNDHLDEILVTSRKRQESILNVPVIETAIPKATIERMQTVDMTDLPNIVPGLDFGRGNLAIGTQVSIRGIGSTSADQGVDQSVALNIDGLAPGSALAFESGLFDLEQIEVLKGPQALFFGKSTPGGVIALRTADPTDKLEVTARTAYEFESLTPREEMILSGPVTDTLKLRLAAMYSTTQGYFYNRAEPIPGTGATAPTDSREPGSTNYNIRGTMLWSPWSRLDARLKLNLVHDRATNQEAHQLTSCPEGPGFAPAGIPFIGPNDNCQLSRDNRVVYMDPAYFPGIINNGVPFVDTKQTFGILELNYRPADHLTVTSVTADYQLISNSLINPTESTGAGDAFAAENLFHRRETTEELRVSSDYGSPLNFTAGGYYEDGRMSERTDLPVNKLYSFLQPFLTSTAIPVTIKTYSAFGQLRYAILPTVEAAAGVRYSDETRTEAPVDPSGAPIAVAKPRIHSDNSAPEVTVTYRPTDDITAFAAYKQAYKSGSFSLGTTPTPGSDNSFDQEKAQGGELGLKSRLLDRRLAVNIAAYVYNYSGLQVGAIEPTEAGQFVIKTVNAGSARTYGIDLDSAYRPAAVEGLGLNGALNWNRAKYITLNNVPCWGGQTIAAGCNQILNSTTGLYTAQNLNGTPLIRAPQWQAHIGFDYSFALPADYRLVFSNNNAFSSSYATYLAVGRPNHDNLQTSFFKTDMSVTLNGPNDGWQLAVIGKDLNNKLTVGNCAASNNANAGVFGGEITGGTAVGPAGIDQVGCYVDPGREVWLRLTVHPFAPRN